MKRVMDVAVAGTALVVLAPVMLAIVLVIRVSMGSPVLYRQRRPGLNGRIFTIYKFRTMTDERDDCGRLLPDEVRLTRVGRLLRSFSLDELPQFWNVLIGDMSLVGPRPLRVEYLHRYTPEQARRHSVKPGITGWAQVNGRNCLVFSRRLALDVWYVDHFSLWLDFKILLLTLHHVISRKGVGVDQNVREIDDLGIYQGHEHMNDIAVDMERTTP